MSEHGKRGPNGGLIDIDDPREVFPPDPVEALVPGLLDALDLVEFAVRERIDGRDNNANALMQRAARRLARMLIALPSRETGDTK